MVSQRLPSMNMRKKHLFSKINMRPAEKSDFYYLIYLIVLTVLPRMALIRFFFKSFRKGI